MIALYNVKRSSNPDTTFYSVYKSTGFWDALFLTGDFGLGPSSVTKYLKSWFGKQNVTVSSVFSPANMGEHDAVIVAYLWYDGAKFGAHYFAAINNGMGIYTPYNDWRIKKGSLATVFNSIQGWTVHFWGIYFR